MSLSAQQAAAALGVSRMQISRLVHQGNLRASRLGNALMIDPQSVNEYRSLRPDRGRPLSPRKAWERIAEESTRSAALDEGALMESVRQLAIVARRRADRQPYRVLPNRLPALFADDRVVLFSDRAAIGRVHESSTTSSARKAELGLQPGKSRNSEGCRLPSFASIGSRHRSSHWRTPVTPSAGPTIPTRMVLGAPGAASSTGP